MCVCECWCPSSSFQRAAGKWRITTRSRWFARLFWKCVLVCVNVNTFVVWIVDKRERKNQPAYKWEPNNCMNKHINTNSNSNSTQVWEIRVAKYIENSFLFVLLCVLYVCLLVLKMSLDFYMNVCLLVCVYKALLKSWRTQRMIIIGHGRLCLKSNPPLWHDAPVKATTTNLRKNYNNTNK